MRRLLALILMLCLCFCLCACGSDPVVTPTTTAAPTEATTTVSTTETAATTTLAAPTDTTASETLTTTTVTDVATTSKRTLPTRFSTRKPSTTVQTTTTTTTKKTTATTVSQEEKPLRILSIGNSYSMDAHHFLSALAAHEGRRIRTVNLYHSGCSLKKHYDFWQNNEAAYQYEVNGKIDWNSHVSLLDILPTEQWDIITLQESSYASATTTEHQTYLDTLLKALRFYCPNAKIYLHQTWAYGDGYSAHSSATGGSMAGMWAKVKDFYDRESAATGLPLIPAGEAMFAAQQAFNARGLGESIQRDGSHASESWGRYLLALVWYKTLTGETPSNTFDDFDGYYIPDDEVRAMIHKVAMDTVAAYK